jgi:hypothetical protein
MEWFVVWIVIASVVIIIMKKVCFVIRWRMGWRPKILNEKCMEGVAKEGAAMFVAGCKEINPEAYEGVSAEQMAGMQKDVEEYTRWAIDDYIRRFCICS